MSALKSSCGVARVEQLDMPEFAQSTDMWSALMAAADQPSFRDHLENGSRVNLAAELARTAVGRGSFTAPALALALVEHLPGRCAPRYVAKLAEQAAALKARLNKVLGDTGVLVFPCHPTVAPVHHLPLFRPFNFS